MARWSTLAAFAVAHARVGRTVGSRLNSKDVLSRYAQRQRGLQVLPLDKAPAGDDGWSAMALENRRTGPAEMACFRVDFSQWLRTLSVRKRRIALACGETTAGAAQAFGLSRARISQLRRELADSRGGFQQDAPDAA